MKQIFVTPDQFEEIVNHQRKEITLLNTDVVELFERNDIVRIEEMDYEGTNTGRYADAAITYITYIHSDPPGTYDILSIEIKHQYLIYNKQQ